MVKRVAQGDVVTVAGAKYRFDENSAGTFNVLLTLKTAKAGLDTRDKDISMQPVGGGEQVLVPFDDLQKAVEEAQAKEEGEE